MRLYAPCCPPEELRLSPDKYREKLEGINTGYQNAKDTHEQEQSDYEAELYEIETVWYKKMLDKAEDYLIRSAECIVLGNFTDEVTLLGVAGQITLGILDLDLPCDIRDIIADVRNLAKADDIKWDMIAMLALDLIGVIPVIGALKYSDEIGTLFKNADKVSVVARSTDGAGVLAKHADEAGAWLHGGKVFRYSDETAEAVASGEKLLKESQTVYESFADMMSPDDAAKYLDFLENGSREGLTGAELAGVEKADALLVSQKVGYEDVWDLRNAGDALETSYGKSTLNSLKNTENFTESAIEHIFEGQVNARGKAVGYHYEGIEGTSGNVIPGTESSVNNIGVYKAQVEVNGIPKTANGGFSTFYSKNLSPQQVVDAINEAYSNCELKLGTRNTYQGVANNGMKIDMFLDQSGKIISAFPEE